MRTIVLESNGMTSSSHLTDTVSGKELTDVVRIEFADLDVGSGKLWCAILHFGQWDLPYKESEQVYIQVTPRNN